MKIDELKLEAAGMEVVHLLESLIIQINKEVDKHGTRETEFAVMAAFLMEGQEKINKVNADEKTSYTQPTKQY